MGAVGGSAGRFRRNRQGAAAAGSVSNLTKALKETFG
jgi:hypothetical protein